MMSIEQLRFRFPRVVGAIEARIAFVAKAISFGLVGVVNTGVDFCVFWIAAQEFGLPLVVANVISWTVAVSGSYVMNSMFTFAAESGRKLGWRPYGTFLASGVGRLRGGRPRRQHDDSAGGRQARAACHRRSGVAARRREALRNRGELRGELLAVGLRRVSATGGNRGGLVGFWDGL